MKDPGKCESCARRTSLIGLLVCLVLAALKLAIGYLGRSHALLASGMCNVSDLTSSTILFLGIRYSRRKPNRRYPYGYGKLEFIIQFGMSLFMILGTVLILASSFFVIAKRTIVIPHTVVFFAAILSATVNALVYKFASCGARELNSPALRAHAEHNKIDVVGSLAVAVGVVVARTGLHWVDPLIAIFECGHVIHGGIRIFLDGFRGVMDVSVPQTHIEALSQMALEIEEVQAVKKIRARESGSKIVLDIAVELAPDLTVLESKRISQALTAHLRKNDKYLGTIFVQVVPAQQVEP